MKFILTIEADTKEQLMALLSGSAAFVATAAPSSSAPLPMPQTTQADDGDEDEPANTNAPQFDSAGLPWDARIHVKSKNQNADGTWRKQRKLDPAIVQQVENELRSRGGVGGMQQMQQPVQQQPMQMQQPMVQQQPMQMPDQQMQQPMQQPMVQQPMQQMQAAPDFGTVMRNIGQAFTTMKADGSGPLIDPLYLATLCQHVQVGNIGEIQNDPNKVMQIYTKLVNDGRYLNV